MRRAGTRRRRAQRCADAPLGRRQPAGGCTSRGMWWQQSARPSQGTLGSTACQEWTSRLLRRGRQGGGGTHRRLAHIGGCGSPDRGGCAHRTKAPDGSTVRPPVVCGTAGRHRTRHAHAAPRPLACPQVCSALRFRHAAASSRMWRQTHLGGSQHAGAEPAAGPGCTLGPPQARPLRARPTQAGRQAAGGSRHTRAIAGRIGWLGRPPRRRGSLGCGAAAWRRGSATARRRLLRLLAPTPGRAVQALGPLPRRCRLWRAGLRRWEVSQWPGRRHGRACQGRCC